MKFAIGDLVKPNEKARERNEIFSSDRRFMVTAIEHKSLFSEFGIWCMLATKDSNGATYMLPETELELVRPFEWIF